MNQSAAGVAALLQQAIAAAKVGDKAKARPLLIDVTEMDPGNEAAWMWRASVSLTPKDAAWCLNKVLALNPANKQAQGWLDKIRSMTPVAPAPPPDAPARPLAPPPPAPPPAPPATVAEAASSVAPAPVWTCPFCGAVAPTPHARCFRCGAVQTLADLNALWENTLLDAEAVRRAALRFEAAPPTELSAEGRVQAAVAYLNLKNPERALTHLRVAVQLRPQDGLLRQRLDEVRRRSVPPDDLTPKTISTAAVTLEPSPSLARKIVLAVDDSLTVRKIVAMTLEKNGYRVVTASDGQEALTRLRETVPDLILLDITMPGMDGYQVCRQIRSNKAMRHIPIVMLSGKDGFFDKVQGRLAGAAQYITKPFEPDDLLQSVKKHLKEK
jgi:twitching motility two-component system response regulator PilG